jgi:hypothetical protein
MKLFFVAHLEKIMLQLLKEGSHFPPVKFTELTSVTCDKLYNRRSATEDLGKWQINQPSKLERVSH